MKKRYPYGALDKRDVEPGAPFFGKGLWPCILVVALLGLWRYGQQAWIGHHYDADPKCEQDYGWMKCRPFER